MRKKTWRKTGRSSRSRSMWKNGEEDWKEHLETQYAEKVERIQKEPEQTKRRSGGYSSCKGRNKGGATTRTTGAAATLRTETNPITAEGKPVGVDMHRIGEKQRQHRKTKKRPKKRCGTQGGLERAQH